MVTFARSAGEGLCFPVHFFLGWHFRLSLGCDRAALKVAFAETWKNAALGLGLVCPSVCVCVYVWLVRMQDFLCEVQCVNTRVTRGSAPLSCALQCIQKGLSAGTTAALNHLQPAQTGLI